MEKYRFLKNRPNPNPDKWKTDVGFQEVLSKVQNPTAPFWMKPIYLAAAAGIIAVTALIFWGNTGNKNDENLAQDKEDHLSDSIRIQEKIDAVLFLPFEEAWINNKQDTTLVCSDGSEIEIPANCFTTSSLDSIRFKYRSFKHPVEFIHAQIPMTVLETNEQLESAGMIELRAFQNDQELALKKGMSLKVSLPSRHQEDNFKLYRMDDEEDGWVCIGKDKMTPMEKEEKEAADEDKDRAFNAEEDLTLKTLKKDSLAFVKKEIEVLRASEPIKPRIDNPNAYDFVIDFKPEEFPELKAFKNVSFEIIPGEDGFDPKYYNVIWEDVELRKEGQVFRVVLKQGSQSVSLRVWPVVEPEDYEASLENFNKEFAAYERKRNARLEEEKRLEQDLELLVKSKEARRAYHERNQKTWDDNLKRTNFTLWQTKNFEGVIERSFEVTTMGTYNCDRVINTTVNQVALNLKAEDGRNLALNNVYIINGNRNTAYRFTTSTLSAAFYLANGAPNMVVCFDVDATHMYYGFIQGSPLPLKNKSKETLKLKSQPIEKFNRETVNALFLENEEPNA
jgi:hypothetical protein